MSETDTFAVDPELQRTVLVVAQQPPLIGLGPIMLYGISTRESTSGAVAFVVYSLVVSISDAILKPLFLGHGTELPMPVILIGAIGGLILHGLIGLFVGAVVFSIGYRLITMTMEESREAEVQDVHSPG